MFEFLSEALKALSGYPIIQATVAILVLFAGIYLWRRAELDRKTSGPAAQAMPAWTLYGPAHDAMLAIHAIAEQGRATNHILERIEDTLSDISKDQRETKQTIEMIRNESRLR